LDSEEKLVHRVAWQLRRSGYIVTAEVPVGMRSVDLFCVERETGTTLAVEAKLKDWRRAIRQAEAYKFAADFVYLALPEEAVSQKCLTACEKAGIGIFEVPAKGLLKRRLIGQPHDHKRNIFSHGALTAVGRKAAYAALYA
jgi:hypothetical protein